jgi:AAA+ superfamily predicted ATPase
VSKDTSAPAAQTGPDLVGNADNDVPNLHAFARLDALLWQAMAAARIRFGVDAAADPFRGLYLSADQAADSLGREAGRPLAGEADGGGLPAWAGIIAGSVGWARIQEGYGLSEAELDIVLIAAAPEIDLRYERVYGYLQDDVTRRRPTVDLALDLVSRTVAEKLTRRALFAGTAPLRRFGLLDLAADPGTPAPPLLAHIVVPGEQVVDLLAGQRGPGRRLSPFGRAARPAAGRSRSVPLSRAKWASLVALAEEDRPVRLQLRGGGTERLKVAQALAAELRAPLLVIDLARLTASGLTGADQADLLTLAFSTARVQEAVLYLDGVDDVLGAVPAGCCWPRLEQELADHTGVTVLAADQAWRSTSGEPSGVLEVSLDHPGFAVRRRAWRGAIVAHGIAATPADVADLAASFRFGPDRIAEAVASAAQAAQLAGGQGAHAARARLFAAARRQSGHDLSALTRRIDPRYEWDDLVLPPDSTTQLREICQRIALRERVLGDWGFGSKLSRGRGTTALFAGAPGTGKTMAAEVVAGELGLDLFTIDLSAVISKYIGETEKNLERIFGAAADADAILFFDEADALFGKRSEVRDAHDRYANIEVAYLLQRMEQYEGIAILATNKRQHLDDAFTRRLAFVVDFPFPADSDRRLIWQLSLASAPLAAGVDLDLIARDFRLSGGSIKNAALQAAYLAAGESTEIGMTHLVAAVHRELRKMGRVPPEPAGLLTAGAS